MKKEIFAVAAPLGCPHPLWSLLLSLLHAAILLLMLLLLVPLLSLSGSMI